MSNSPLGLGFPGLSVGVVFYVDLVFSLSSAIDLEGGFYVKVADGAFMEASIFGGEITESFFEGLSSKPLPVTVKSGSATFKADLRLRVQCGASADIDLIGLGAGAELGIYANLIEYVAVLESTPTCALQCRQWWDLNVGAYARLDVVIDYKTLGAVPTVSTTLLTAPTLTQCWLSRSPSAESAGLGATSAGASAGAPSVVVSSYASYVSTTGMSMATPEATTLSVSLSASTSASSASASSVSSHYLLSNSTASSTVESANVVTSTAYTTTVYTITSCAVTVPNCPASFQSEIVVTKTVDLNTASTATGTSLSSSSTAAAEKGAAAVVTIITDVIVLVPCATPVVETFIEPTSRSSSSSSSSSTFTAAGLAASSSAAGGALAPTSTALAPPVIAHGWLNTNATSLTAASVSSTGAGDYSRPTTAPIQTAGAAGTAGASGEVLALFAAGAGALLLLL
ncbi:hypothetical protein B0H63DRAFT_277765 [Podospora didyma]|uniref:Uncharacterized protein n=1 Tax=Podospora didyma TaxID=330526 RepID=A0AAE0KF67_9PEZI|nr:hypothetical protein B0H63DRAFT_277765 [Podospora didyma]